MMIDKKSGCEIWAVGGGKGGTGKSFVISSMACYLASVGKRVLLVDADLGGANLHSLLGLERPKKTLAKFFQEKTPLSELIIPTDIERLGLLTGAIGSLGAENMKYVQKVKFLTHIKQLDADYVLIDLGAGTHFNTVDAFLLADKMVVATLPEITAIENMYTFFKNAFYRKIAAVFKERGLKYLVTNMWDDRVSYNIKNLKELVDLLRTVSEEASQIIDNELARFTVNIVVNQVRDRDQALVGEALERTTAKYLGHGARCIGHVSYDEQVSKCINSRQPLMRTHPDSPVAAEIARLTEILLAGGRQ